MQPTHGPLYRGLEVAVGDAQSAHRGGAPPADWSGTASLCAMEEIHALAQAAGKWGALVLVVWPLARSFA